MHVVFFLGGRKSSQNVEIGLKESKKLLKDKADKLNKTEEQSNSFKQARRFLDQKKMVVITGVQGSGKTFFARALVTALKKKSKSNIMECIWISNENELLQIKKKPIREFDIYVFDGIFYELQMDVKFEETINALNDYSNSTKIPHLIFTIPSHIWQKHSKCNEFETWLGEVRVDLDKRSESEKRKILKHLMDLYDVPRELAVKICQIQNTLLKEVSSSIGFPALISWICKQSSEEEVDFILRCPLQSMSNKVVLLKNAPAVEKSGKYLILAYMSLKDGKMDVVNVDKELFYSLKKTFVPRFLDEDLDKCAASMVGYFLLRNEDDGSYEFDLNIMKKIVLASLAKENARFVQIYCKHDYLKYVITTKLCPNDMDTFYAECYKDMLRMYGNA